MTCDSMVLLSLHKKTFLLWKQVRDAVRQKHPPLEHQRSLPRVPFLLNAVLTFTRNIFPLKDFLIGGRSCDLVAMFGCAVQPRCHTATHGLGPSISEVQSVDSDPFCPWRAVFEGVLATNNPAVYIKLQQHCLIQGLSLKSWPQGFQLEIEWVQTRIRFSWACDWV